MTMIIDGTSGVTFPDTTLQATKATTFAPLGVQIFTSNGTYTPTVGTKAIFLEGMGGGGGGGPGQAGNAGNTYGASGGGGAQAAKVYGTILNPGTLTVTIGQGGTSGVNGGNTTIGTFTAPGANAGTIFTAGSGSGFSSDLFNLSGTNGSPAVAVNAPGPAGGAGAGIIPAAGGSGGAVNVAGVAGSNGNTPGSGGGGGQGGSFQGTAGGAGGTGGRGYLIIHEFG